MTYGEAIVADAEQKKNRPLEQAIDEAIRQEEIARSILENEPLPAKSLNINIYLHLAKDYRIKGQFLDESGHRDEGIKWATDARQLALQYGQHELAAAIERDLAGL